MRSYLLFTLAVLTLAAASAPALARTVHHHYRGHMYMYAPGGVGQYPNPVGRSGSEANRQELGTAGY